MEKKTISRGLCLYLAFFLVFLLTGFCFRPVQASAASEPSFVALSYEQTLALYGSSFDVSYYRVNQNDTISCKAVFAGTTDNYTPASDIDDLSFKSKVFFPPVYGNTTQYTNNDYGYGGLVYAILPNDGVGGINGWYTPWQSWQQSNTGDHANISIDFPITFTGISRFVQPFFWTIGTYTTQQADRSSLSFTTSSGLYSVTPARALSSGTAFNRFGYGVGSLFWSNPRVSLWSDVPERLLQNFALLFADLGESDYSTVFDISAMHYTLNNVYGVPVIGRPDSSYDRFGDITFTLSGYCPFIIVGRPRIYGYVPPETTTAPATTRPPTGGSAGTAVTYVTPQPVDLSTLESGVAAIVNEQIDMNANLDWIGNNVYIGTNNLAFICDMLDKIYAKMVADGQIAVNLVSADSLHTMPADVHTQLHAAIQGFTTSQIPDAGNGYTFFNDLYSHFTSDSLSFFGVFGGFSLAFSVIAWFIFRGRH